MRWWRQRWYVRRHEWNGWIRHFQTRTSNNEHLFWSSLYFVKIPTFLRHFLSGFFSLSDFWKLIRSFVVAVVITPKCHLDHLPFHWSFAEILHKQDYTRRIHSIHVKTINVLLCVYVALANCWIEFLAIIYRLAWKKKIAVSRSSSRLDQSMRIGREREKEKSLAQIYSKILLKNAHKLII